MSYNFELSIGSLTVSLRVGLSLIDFREQIKQRIKLVLVLDLPQRVK